MKRTHGLDEREMELVKLLMADCQTTGDIQAKLKKLFAGTIEQMLEAEMDEHLAPLLFTVYLAAASGRSPALPCFAAFLALVCFSGLFAFTQLFFQNQRFSWL